MSSFRLLALVAIFVTTPCFLFAQDAETGSWTRLFNGSDLSGWKPYLAPNTTVTADQVWSVKDGTIICLGKPAGYIKTDNTYSNFELRLKWRWAEGDVKGRNSGVLLHSTGVDKIWPKSAEAQLASGAAGDFWLIDGFQLQVDPARQDPKTPRHFYRLKNDAVEKPIGEWNQYEITCTTDTIRLKINGLVVNEGTQPELAGGHICLQSEGAEIHFRDVEIRALE